MGRVWNSTLIVTGLVLQLGGAPSWGWPPNLVGSDSNGNTAGGATSKTYAVRSKR